jgi:cytochrome c oxidase subunit II
MFKDFPLIPGTSSTGARLIDQYFWAMVLITGVATVLVCLAVIYFALKYRRRHEDEIPTDEEAPQWLEIAWTVIPFIIFMGMFAWGAWVYFHVQRPPDDTLDIYVTAKQWMWKFQHVDGTSEINDLHVPVGRPVRLIMASEDVIHSFFVPEFRVTTDVLPHRYTYQWFEATRTGKFHHFCSEYCGTEHSGMIGTVYVMEPAEYQAWLSGGVQDAPANVGKKLFEQYACNTCHTNDATARGPVLTGLFGQMVPLQDGRSVRADENYLRESILNPQAKIVRGFQPIMPTFRGQLNEEQIIQLIEYIKSLSAPDAGAGQPGAAGGTAAPPQADPTRSGSTVDTQPAGAPGAGAAGSTVNPQGSGTATPGARD